MRLQEAGAWISRGWVRVCVSQQRSVVLPKQTGQRGRRRHATVTAPPTPHPTHTTHTTLTPSSIAGLSLQAVSDSCRFFMVTKCSSLHTELPWGQAGRTSSIAVI